MLLVFVAILAGRFSLDRLSAALPAFDLRLGFLYVLVLAIGLWFAGAHERIPKPQKVAGSGFFVAWAGWLLLSAIWAPADARLGDKVLDMVLLLALTLIAWVVMSRLPAEATGKIWKWMLVAALIYFALAMAAGPGAQGRYAAPGGGPNVFVRVMILGALAALFYASQKKKLFPLLPVPLFAVGAALSGSRGGLLSALIIFLVFAVPIARQLGAGKVIAILIVLGGAGTLLALQNNSALLKFVQERYVQQTFVEGYSSGRDLILEDAMRLYNESPIIGKGLDGYFALQNVSGEFEYPHNLTVATMAESGAIGLAFMLGAIGSALVTAFRFRRVPTVLFASLAGLYLLIASQFSGDYYDTRLMWFFFGFAAIEAARPRLSRSSTAPQKSRGPKEYTGASGTSRPRLYPGSRLPAQTRR